MISPTSIACSNFAGSSNLKPWKVMISCVALFSLLQPVSSLVCFYCSEHYQTCETYQRYQNCQPNEDRCYILRSSDQVMQGCGQSFLAYCNEPGVCHEGDLSNCFGRQCPLLGASSKLSASNLFSILIPILSSICWSLSQIGY